jgi:hypothetical protein
MTFFNHLLVGIEINCGYNISLSASALYINSKYFKTIDFPTPNFFRHCDLLNHKLIYKEPLQPAF